MNLTIQCKLRPTLLSVLLMPLIVAVPAASPSSHDFNTGTGTSPGPPSNPIGSNPAPRNACEGLEPVYLADGDFFLDRQDFFLPGRGLSIGIAFTYRSQSVYNAAFGYGWDMNYNRRLKKLADGNIVLMAGQGRTDEFAVDGPTYTAQGVYANLLENVDGTYSLEFPGGYKEVYDPNGNLILMEDRNGNALTFLYDPAGPIPIIGRSDYFVNQDVGVIAREYRLVQIIDPVGRPVDFTYDGMGRLESLHYAGRTVRYAYDPTGTGDLISVTTPETSEYPQGLTTVYAYDNHNLVTITDPKDQTYLTNVYDATTDRVTNQTFAGGTSQIVYGVDGSENRTATVTDGKGFVEEWSFNESGNALTKRELTAGLRPDDPPEYLTQWTYNADLEQTGVILPGGSSILYTFDSGNANRLAQGNLLELRMQAPPNSGEADLVASVTYEPNYQFPKRVTDPMGRTVTYVYDYELGEPNHGNLRTIEYPSVGGPVETRLTYNAHGQIVTLTDPNGHVTQIDYDFGTGYPTGITYGVGSPEQAATQLSYDQFGNLEAVTDARGNTTGLAYDELDQLIQIASPSPFLFKTKFFYDENGNLKQVDRQNDDPANPWITTAYTYTDFDELKTITNELGLVTAMDYDANRNRTLVRDAELNDTLYQYDERDLLWKATDAMQGVTQFAYNANGRLSQVQDANGNPTTYEYDGFERLTRMVYADPTHDERFIYDANSNLLVRTVPNGHTISYSYDELDRLILKLYPDGSMVSFGYDQGSRLRTVLSQPANLSYEYDALNRVRTASQTLNGIPYPLDYQYDTVGNRTQLVYPSGTTLGYDYDELNRLREIRRDSKVLAEFTYDALSRRKTKQLGTGGGVLASYQWDPLGRLTELRHQRVGGAPGTALQFASMLTISQFLYSEYDKVGNRKTLEIVRNTQLTQESYTYDSLYQLTAVSGDQTHAFTYDGLGNRLLADGLPYAPNTMNQYTNVGGIPLTYDANGNLTSHGDFAYTYDFDDRLVSAVSGGMSATYEYDPFSRRIMKDVNGSAIVYIHDGNQIIEERTIGGALQASYVYGTDIDEPLTMTRGAGTYYYLLDGLGSVADLTTQKGEVIESYAYDVFGMPDNSSAIENPFYYTGRELDLETNLYYYRHRYYSPALGRFLSRDPIGYLPDMNLYRFVGNNPATLTDPYGFYAIALGFGATAGAATPVGWIFLGAVVVVYGGTRVYEWALDKEADAESADNEDELDELNERAKREACDQAKRELQRQKQNSLIDKIVKDLGLSKGQRRQLHDGVTGQNYEPGTIREIAEYIKHYYPNI